MKYKPDLLTISENHRQLGRLADKRLLQDMQEDGWEPKNFQISSRGLSIEFAFVGIEAQRYEYKCYQEGGNAEAFVSCLNTDLKKGKWEVLFAYRVNLKGSDQSGTYIRCIMRREIDPKNRQDYKYHFAYRSHQQKNVARIKTLQRICSLPAHAGWQDKYAYDLFKEVH
jgi:hypothetical protein